MKQSDDPTLPTYIDSLRVDVMGSMYTHSLSSNMKYNTVVNIINYFAHSEFSNDVCRREVFNAVNLLDAVLEINANIDTKAVEL